MQRFGNRLLSPSLLLLLSVTPLAAQPATATRQERDIPVTLGSDRGEDAPRTSNVGWPQTLVFLSLAVAAVWLLLRLLRRARLGAGRNPQLFQHIACQPLPGGGILHLVSVDDRVYLLGSQSGSLRLIDVVDSAERRDRLLLLASRQPRTRTFAALLASIKMAR